MDGHAVVHDIQMEFGKSMTLRFELSFLSPNYFVGPSFFSITLDDSESDRGDVSYGCGSMTALGELNMSNSMNCVFPDDDRDWAVFLSSRFGDTGLNRWMRTQNQ